MTLNIREMRKRKKWTQEYVAQKIGLTRTAVHDIETGKQKPSYNVLVRLEDLFKMSHRKLFEPVDETYTK
jgi:transcriptional regulator with XRE-family HTH domain